MNEEWKDWTKLNLANGCAPDEINSILQSNGFSNNEIKAAMGSRYPGGKKSYSKSLQSRVNSAKNAGEKYRQVDYDSLTKIKITSNPKAKKHDADELQLYALENFLTPAECKILIKQIDGNLRPSTITSGTDYGGVRTSSTCDLGLVKHLQVQKIDQKIAETLGVQLSWSETMQGQKYDVSQEFKAHTDYFTPNTKEFEEFAAEMGQRTWTFMVYLNSTPEGGETHFTKIDKAFYPKQGMAVIWNNLLADGSPNPFTMHHGCPVHKGTKYIVTKWFRDKGQGDMYYPN